MSESNTSPFQITVESPDACQRTINVQVPRTEYERRYQQNLAAAVRGYQRPGFRKGKTPAAVVEKELGGRLRAETFENMVPEAYRLAVIEHRMFPITEPAVENLVFEDDKDLAFDLKVEVRPEVTATEYEGLEVTRRAVEVTDDEVQQVVDRLRESRSSFEKVDRAAADGDQVVLDLVPHDDAGEPQDDRKLEGQRLVLGDENNLPAFNDALLGVKAGEEPEFPIEYPADYPNPELQNQTVKFKCRIEAVEEKVTPEADDSFASQLEEGQTLLELRVKIREGLEDEAAKRIAQELDEQALDQLIVRNEVPVPPSMVKTWLDSGVNDLRQRQAQAGRELNDEEIERYREAAQPVAERQIKGLFLLQSVRQQEKLTVSDEMVEERILEIASEHGFDLEKYREYLAQGDEKDRIRRDLEERQTYDFLLSRAEITDGAPKSGAEEG